ncbi:ring-cleaving dioxygenase [Aureimonas populi]|uniref:Ring-cleaving dioxygenase n=1 Tax=Aureimonas populi TaxID=1701758 RepID=A0ABW5CLN9_9HYPH|nr:ring-cleaving dioxygenase [Aureimonas populi]
MSITTGLHHVSIHAGDPGRNVEFYTAVLGLRLVKKTVNFEDAGVYHLYFGDEAARPGTLLTFFPYPHIAPGRLGVGEVEEIGLRVPAASLGFWMHRFLEKGVVHEGIVKRFGQSLLPFRDPDGTRLALVGLAGIEDEPAGGAIAPEHAIRGFHGVSLLLEEAGPTAAVLTHAFGFVEMGSEGTRTRYGIPGATIGGVVDLHAVGGFLKPRPGGGSVHHIAFRAEDDAAQAEMARKLAQDHDLDVTEVKDRKYFRSVYAREPGHVLLEIATDQPGMSIDEPMESLGQTLQLPPFFEARRSWIEKSLPPIRLTEPSQER